jgi:hypothetical protein
MAESGYRFSQQSRRRPPLAAVLSADTWSFRVNVIQAARTARQTSERH